MSFRNSGQSASEKWHIALLMSLSVSCGATTGLRPADEAVSLSPAAAIALSYGSQHLCVLSTQGRVRCHGLNWAGQLGVGALGVAWVVGGEIPNLRDITQVHVNPIEGVSCALQRGGAVYCWGSNERGLLGVGHDGDEVCGTTRTRVPCRRTPVRVPGLDNVTMLALSGITTCALRTDGRVLCWGERGPLGNEPSPYPVPASRVSSATGIWSDLIRSVVRNSDRRFSLFPYGQDVGFPEGTEYSGGGVAVICGVTPEHRVQCYGSNRFGLLGELAPSLQEQPVTLPLEGVSSVAVGYTHACVIMSDRSVWCWGDASGGALGAPVASSEMCSGFLREIVPCSRRPVRVVGIDDAVSLAVGNGFSCVLRSDHSIWCWGTLFPEVWPEPRRVSW